MAESSHISRSRSDNLGNEVHHSNLGMSSRSKSIDFDSNGYGTGSSRSVGGIGIPRTRRSARKSEDDEYHKKWDGMGKKEEKSRAELLGVTQPRIPKAALKKMERNGAVDLQNASVEELEQVALEKVSEVTSDLRNVLKITRSTEDIGAQTLSTLKQQGEQIYRTHGKVVELDQELAKGETLLGKLGPMFSFGWKPKKGKKITGPKQLSEGKGAISVSRSQRSSLLDEDDSLDDGRGDNMAKVKKQMNAQDEMLNEVSASLDVMKDIATGMGTEMDQQDKAIDDLSGDVDELNSRLKQANQRGRKLLGK